VVQADACTFSYTCLSQVFMILFYHSAMIQ
jgi:hypothetical protein